MATPTYAWTVDFTITIDRAGHLVVEQLDDQGATIRAIDFGVNGGPTPVILTWLELDKAARDDLSPAINSHLTTIFTVERLREELTGSTGHA
jgi:hypothetical protein